MSKLTSFLKAFTKEKKKEVRDDSFTIDKGRWNYTVTTIIPRGQLVDFFNAMKRKAPTVKEGFDSLAKDSWELDEQNKFLMEKKIIYNIVSFDEIINQVKSDLPKMVITSQKVSLMRFEKVDNTSYRVIISLSGTCSGV